MEDKYEEVFFLRYVALEISHIYYRKQVALEANVTVSWKIIGIAIRKQMILKVYG